MPLLDVDDASKARSLLQKFREKERATQSAPPRPGPITRALGAPAFPVGPPSGPGVQPLPSPEPVGLRFNIGPITRAIQPSGTQRRALGEIGATARQVEAFQTISQQEAQQRSRAQAPGLLSAGQFIGRAAGALDAPIIDQFDTNLPGPISGLARELTRPTNLLAALVPGLSFAQKATLPVRLGAEAVASGLGRFAGERAATATEDAPLPVRIAAPALAGLAAGVAGGIGAARGFSGAQRGASVAGRQVDEAALRTAAGPAERSSLGVLRRLEPQEITEFVPQAPVGVGRRASPEAVSSRKWFHGTGTEGLSAGTLDPAKTASHGLFGPGIYLTDDPRVAAGYAAARGEATGKQLVYEASVNPLNTLDLETPLHPDVFEAVLDTLGYHVGGSHPDELIRQAARRAGATNEDVILAGLRGNQDRTIYGVVTGPGTLGYVDVPANEDALRALGNRLYDKGVDALTHTGGQRVGDVDHQVLIVLKPTGPRGQSVSGFTPRSPEEAAGVLTQTTRTSPSPGAVDPFIPGVSRPTGLAAEAFSPERMSLRESQVRAAQKPPGPIRRAVGAGLAATRDLPVGMSVRDVSGGSLSQRIGSQIDDLERELRNIGRQSSPNAARQQEIRAELADLRKILSTIVRESAGRATPQESALLDDLRRTFGGLDEAADVPPRSRVAGSAQPPAAAAPTSAPLSPTELVRRSADKNGLSVTDETTIRTNSIRQDAQAIAEQDVGVPYSRSRQGEDFDSEWRVTRNADGSVKVEQMSGQTAESPVLGTRTFDSPESAAAYTLDAHMTANLTGERVSIGGAAPAQTGPAAIAAGNADALARAEARAAAAPAIPAPGAGGAGVPPGAGGAGVPPGAAPTPGGVYSAPPTVRRLYGTRAIEEGDVRGAGERIAESGRFRPDDPIVTPALRVRNESRQAVMNQATRITSQARSTIKRSGFVFKGPPDAQRIPALAGIDPSVPGAPTLRDVMARRPTYEPHLTPQQRAALDTLGESLTPYRQGLDEVVQAETSLTGKPSTIQIGQRADVMDGGTYIPRGTAETEELADIAARRVGGGGRRVGGRQGFEKSATFASEAEGIEAGYRYTPVAEAMGGYVRGAGNRTLDRHTANYFISRTDDAGKRIAETRADRVDPSLREDIQKLRARISGRSATFGRRVTRQQAQERAAVEAERTTAGVESIRDKRTAAFDDRTNLSTDEAIRAAERELTSLERAANQTDRAAGVARGRADRTAIGALDTSEELASFRAEYDTMNKRWQSAQEAAQSTPRDQGTIPLAGLEAYSFPWEMADEAARSLKTELKGAAGDISGPLRGINSVARGVQATGEMSYLGIQMSVGMYSDPVGWTRAGKASTKAWLNSGDEVLGDYFTKVDLRDAAKGLPDSEWWAAHGLRFGGAGTEFRLGGRALPARAQSVADSRVGRVVTAVPRQLVKRADRGFGVAGDTMRRELVSTLAEEAQLKGIPLDDAWGRATAESANRVTGWTPQRAFGSWGEAVNFAPRYLAARARSLGQLASKDPRKRQLARRLIGRYMALGVTMTVAANELAGEETDFRPFFGKNGPTFDPFDAEYKNPNFLRVINQLGRDWSLLGPVDAMAGIAIGVGSLITNPTGNPKEALNRMRAVASGPLAALGIDWLVFGENFEREALIFDSPEGQMDLLQRVVPFAAPQLVQSATEVQRSASQGDVAGAASEAVGGAIEGFVGGRGSNVSTRERVRSGEFSSLSAEKQLEAVRFEAWKRVETVFGAGTVNAGTYGSWREARISELTAQLRAVGQSEANAKFHAEEAVEKESIAKFYSDTRNRLEDRWGLDNPQKAAEVLDRESRLRESQRRFRPTDSVRQFIESQR